MNYLVPVTKDIVHQINEDEQKQYLMQSASVTVVKGEYDHIEKIIHAMNQNDANIEMDVVSPYDSFALHPSNLLIVNCPGEIDSRNYSTIADFVNNGGWLVTTDWALDLVYQTFPGVIQKVPDKGTTDDVVCIEADINPITEGVIPGSEFWLEGGSYLIDIINDDKVVPLILSNELSEKYESPFIMVGFQHGMGKVFHSVSHFELQRSKTGNTRRKDAYSSVKILTNIMLQKSLFNHKYKL